MSKITVLSQKEISDVNGGGLDLAQYKNLGQWGGVAVGSWLAGMFASVLPGGRAWYSKIPMSVVKGVVVFSTVWAGGLVGSVVEKLASIYMEQNNVSEKHEEL